jgi:hypothetical protein
VPSDIEKMNDRLEKLEAEVKRLKNLSPTDLTQYNQLQSLLVWTTAAQNILRGKYPAIHREIVAERKRLQNSAQTGRICWRV